MTKFEIGKTYYDTLCPEEKYTVIAKHRFNLVCLDNYGDEVKFHVEKRFYFDGQSAYTDAWKTGGCAENSEARATIHSNNLVNGAN